MNKIIKGTNKNKRRTAALFIAQIVLGMAPILLLIIFIWLELYNAKVTAIIFIILIFLCNVANMIVARRYGVLNSGIHGERELFRTVKHLAGNNIIFCNLPIRYKRGRSELDLLIIRSSGIVIVEVKNHSGVITGSRRSDKWVQRKIYRDGKTVQTDMDNPIKQMRRQRDIVKCILGAEGENVWIDSVLYFSSPNVKLKLDLGESDYVCSSAGELLDFLRNHRSENLSKERMEKIARIMREASPK